MTPIPSHWGILQDLFLEQYKESPKYAGIVQAFASEADKLEACMWEFAQLLDIDLMEGAQLDLLGKIAMVLREQADGTLTDAQYRLELKAAFRRRTSGSPEEIIQAVLEATGGTQVLYLPEYPAAFWILTDGPTPITDEFLKSISPAGVQPFQACYLALTTGELLETTEGDSILIVGPCESGGEYPFDNVWDGGLGAVDPDEMVFTEAWPFRGTTGIGEYPDGGMGVVDPDLLTFTDGSYAEDIGG